MNTENTGNTENKEKIVVESCSTSVSIGEILQYLTPNAFTSSSTEKTNRTSEYESASEKVTLETEEDILNFLKKKS